MMSKRLLPSMPALLRAGSWSVEAVTQNWSGTFTSSEVAKSGPRSCAFCCRAADSPSTLYAAESSTRPDADSSLARISDASERCRVRVRR